MIGVGADRKRTRACFFSDLNVSTDTSVKVHLSWPLVLGSAAGQGHRRQNEDRARGRSPQLVPFISRLFRAASLVAAAGFAGAVSAMHKTSTARDSRQSREPASGGVESFPRFRLATPLTRGESAKMRPRIASHHGGKFPMNRFSKYAVSTIVASAIAVVPVSAAFGVKKCLPDLCDLGPATPHESAYK